jgi:hypothetical protein
LLVDQIIADHPTQIRGQSLADRLDFTVQLFNGFVEFLAKKLTEIGARDLTNGVNFGGMLRRRRTKQVGGFQRAV